jgi:hypothetical protein
MQTTTKQIHIKATCENENRRFCIAEAKFDSLKKLITNLFPQANGIDFSVKYKDDENDLVTISSDDELMFAVNLFPTDILRIVVEFPKKADCAAPCKWQNKCDRRPDEKRCDWLTTKREGVQAKLKALEGADFQAKPGLFYKQEHLKKKLQNIDNKIAWKQENAGENKQGRCPRNFSGPENRQNSCNWMAIKREKVQARLKELEGTDFHENPGLFWKKEKLERKLQAMDAKLACTAENAGQNTGHCDRGGRGKWGRGRGNGRYCQNQRTDCNQTENFCDQKRSRLEAKKGRIQARLKEMESNAPQAQPGSCDWRREHLKKKLEAIEAKLACIDTTKKAHEIDESLSRPTEPVQLAHVQVVPLQVTPGGPVNDKEETKRIRDTLKFEKQQAVTHCHAKKLEYQTAKRAQGADQRKEDIAKLHEEYVKAQEIAFEKKKALGEFNTKTRACREAKN